MTDDTTRNQRPDDDAPDQDLGAPLEEIKPPTKEQEPNVWLREGTDAPDAADIEDPQTQL